jgi:hypothetical protein
MDKSDKNPDDQFPDGKNDDLSTAAHRLYIGGVGLLFPLMLWILAGLRPAVERPWAPLISVSAYYYSGAVSVFSGMLIAMALFLFSYRGYANRYYLRDRVAAIIAGLAAIVIAIFPSGAPPGFPTLSYWTPRSSTIHLGAAVVLFSCFIFFALFQFPLSGVEKGEPLPRDKQVRNWIYRACGVAMVICMLWVTYAGYIRAPIYWPEALALEFFALSWLVKGRAYSTAVELTRDTLSFIRAPRTSVKKALRAVRTPPAPGPAAPQDGA